MMTHATLSAEPRGRLGSLLQERRRALGLTVSEAAIRAGLGYFTVYNLERRPGSRVDLEAVGRVAAALGIQEEELGAAITGRHDAGR